ncbi:MAG: Txe/YoeB family addiction module toxin [Bacteroidota bacterium]
MRSIGFSPKAYNDLITWSVRDKKVFTKLNDLIIEVARDPFKGTGKPEMLKHQYKGFWSRRITQEHRLVYEVTESQIFIVSCDGHYTN